MNRKPIRLGAVVGLGSTCAAVLAFAACGGKSLSIGDDRPTLQPVDLATVFNQPVGACQANYAHPNVCCAEGPGQQAACGDYPGAPFQQCPEGNNTYPDPGLCCPLAAPGSSSGCMAPPPVGAVDAGVTPGQNCVYPCQPGWYQPNNEPGTCCQSDGSDPSAGVCVMTVAVCACPACEPGEDASACGCTCPPAPPSTPVCDSCPPGWVVPDGEPGLCCQTQGNVIDCFSQAVPPPSPPGYVDGGTPPSMGADASTCVVINPADYDQSCNQDSDCVSITPGDVCSTCQCGGAAINVSSQAAYQAAVAGMPVSPPCACPNEPVPTCVNGMCMQQ